MSDGFSLFPPASTGRANLKIVARGAGSFGPAGFEEFAVSRFAVERIFEEPDAEAGRHTMQDKLLGLAVIAVVCAGFWGAVGLVISHFLK